MTSGESKSTAGEKTHHLHYLNEFRVEACPLFKQHQCQQHRPYTCFNWHFANQRRRRPQRKSDGSFNYSPDIYCDKYDENTGICPDGDECVYLHRVSGDVERKYHLRYYKTAQCVHPTDSRGQCAKNGAHCAFAHSSADLRQPQFDQHEAGFSTTMDGDGRDRTSFVIEDPLWHSQDHVLSCYKTEQCRKPARLCRQGYACPFYHNSKDRRRPPAICKYRSTPCPAAKTVDEWLDPELCEAGDSCQYCHTRTEQQFHPEIYKSTKCNDMLEHGYCPRAVFCAFAHHDSELHVQRTPYVTSTQASPKEQSSPNTNGGDSMRFGSPISNGTSAPSYSSVLKQRHPMASKSFSATTDQISGNYPKAPGYERGPLSPNRGNESSMGRLRTHSLNMAHLDLGRRCNVSSFDAAPGTSLPSHSTLCRSDSGFHAVTEELTLDLAPIEEHQKPLTDLFSGNMSSPMRIPGVEPFHTSPLTSFGEMLFGTTKTILNTSSQISAFDNKEGPDVSDELAKTKIELRSHHEKVAIWEEGLKQARQACEAWKADAEHYKMKAEQAEMERNRAVFERDQLMQQLESVKIHLASSGLSLGGIVTSQLAPTNEFSEGVLMAALQSSQPHNIFVVSIYSLVAITFLFEFCCFYNIQDYLSTSICVVHGVHRYLSWKQSSLTSTD
uniref:RING finger protein unkempt n=1 Tax=Haemonchus contortus TaxID=6289 RepID=A0A7I4Z315_HAECO